MHRLLCHLKNVFLITWKSNADEKKMLLNDRFFSLLLSNDHNENPLRFLSFFISKAWNVKKERKGMRNILFSFMLLLLKLLLLEMIYSTFFSFLSLFFLFFYCGRFIFIHLVNFFFYDCTWLSRFHFASFFIFLELLAVVIAGAYPEGMTCVIRLLSSSTIWSVFWIIFISLLPHGINTKALWTVRFSFSLWSFVCLCECLLCLFNLPHFVCMKNIRMDYSTLESTERGSENEREGIFPFFLITHP